MSYLVIPPITLPPATFEVEVDFYDKTERKQFLRTAMKPLLEDFPRRLAISTQDFCAYFLYYKMRPGVSGHANHADMANQWHRALVEFDGQLEFSESSLRLTKAKGTDGGAIEKFGEGIGLGVCSTIHSFHPGDWRRIDETNARKTLDFSHTYAASDGRQFVLVESKGVSNDNNDLKSSSVSNDKKSIKDKKADATKEERKSSILYGTIAVLDDRPGTVARCWLVDPPADVPDNPRRFKILNRLTYIGELLSFLGPRSSLAASLQTRLAALAALDEIDALDGIRLLRGNGEPYSTATFAQGQNHNPWFTSKSVVTDGPVGGQVYAVNEETILFIAIHEKLVILAAEQRFDEIERYILPSASLKKEVFCVVPNGRFRQEFYPLMEIPPAQRGSSNGYVYFTLSGHLHHCSSGLVFGVLPIPASWQKN